MSPSDPTSAQIATLRERGYVRLPGFVPPAELRELNQVARAQLRARAQPLELEADLQYPGAPKSRESKGGETIRRLLNAYQRDPCFARQATSDRLRRWMEAYFAETTLLSTAHHNCLMTKHPRYGSLTGWHRDIRYWSFAREDLVSVWLALGEERNENGGLWLVPGSHRADFGEESFDAAKFFRADHAGNAALLATAESPPLAAGDALFFHCRALHSAGQNTSAEVKLSLVFTYHAKSNPPVAGSRSASKPDVPLAP